MAVKSGTPLVSVGDSVKSGTTLISGLIYYYSDDFTVTQTDKIKADGEIVMRTKRGVQQFNSHGILREADHRQEKEYQKIYILDSINSISRKEKTGSYKML